MSATDYCLACGQPAGVCAVCGGPGRLHEHVSGDWYCPACVIVLRPAPGAQTVEIFRSGGR